MIFVSSLRKKNYAFLVHIDQILHKHMLSTEAQNKCLQPWTRNKTWDTWVNRYTRMCVSFRQYTPLENSMTNRTNTLQNPQTKRDLCKIWGILSKWFEKISNCCVFSMCFCYFIITHTLREKAWPIIFTELNSFFSMDVCFYLVWFKRILWFWRSVCLFVDIVFV